MTSISSRPPPPEFHEYLNMNHCSGCHLGSPDSSSKLLIVTVGALYCLFRRSCHFACQARTAAASDQGLVWTDPELLSSVQWEPCPVRRPRHRNEPTTKRHSRRTSARLRRVSVPISPTQTLSPCFLTVLVIVRYCTSD